MADDTLWSKGLPLDAAIHRFTVGDDPWVDLALAPHDALGSAAHARMLAHVGLLPEADMRKLVAALRALHNEARVGAFTIRPEQEDGHTALEAALVERVGEPGRRIHLGRSRNDQVQLALRLMLREEVLVLGARAAELAGAFLDFAQAHANVPLPGYTHMRRAMPSTFGIWGAAFAEGLLEELEALRGLWARLDRCPLGAAAGFGVPLPIDREYVATPARFLPRAAQPHRRAEQPGPRRDGARSPGPAPWRAAWRSGCGTWPSSAPRSSASSRCRMPSPPARPSCRRRRTRTWWSWRAPAAASCAALARQVEEVAGGLPSSYHRDFQLLKRPTLAGAGLDARAAGGADAAGPRAARSAPRPPPAPAMTRCTRPTRPTSWSGSGLPFRDAYREVARRARRRHLPARSRRADGHPPGRRRQPGARPDPRRAGRRPLLAHRHPPRARRLCRARLATLSRRTQSSSQRRPRRT